MKECLLPRWKVSLVIVFEGWVSHHFVGGASGRLGAADAVCEHVDEAAFAGHFFGRLRDQGVQARDPCHCRVGKEEPRSRHSQDRFRQPPIFPPAVLVTMNPVRVYVVARLRPITGWFEQSCLVVQVRHKKCLIWIPIIDGSGRGHICFLGENCFVKFQPYRTGGSPENAIQSFSIRIGRWTFSLSSNVSTHACVFSFECTFESNKNFISQWEGRKFGWYFLENHLSDWVEILQNKLHW